MISKSHTISHFHIVCVSRVRAGTSHSFVLYCTFLYSPSIQRGGWVILEGWKTLKPDMASKSLLAMYTACEDCQYAHPNPEERYLKIGYAGFIDEKGIL